MYFKNRHHAGTVLANAIYKEWMYKDALVVALPSGGVPVARAIAKKLRAPLEVMAIKKVRVSQSTESAIGAVDENYQIWLNNELINFLIITQEELDISIARAMREVQHLTKILGHRENHLNVRGRSVILVDDGLTTGATMLVAIRSLKMQGAREVAVVIPVASVSGVELIRPEADFIFSAHTPPIYGSVGEWYEDYSDIEDDHLVKLLKSYTSHEVRIKVDNDELTGELNKPEHCKGWIIFAHGSNSCRKNILDLKIAEKYNEEGLGTLLFNFFTEGEIKSHANIQGIEFLAKRLSLVSQWLRERPEWNQLPIGYFGTNSGAAAALQCAAKYEKKIFSIVTRAGRPDYASNLDRITCPVLMIVNSLDEKIIKINREHQINIINSKIKIVSNGYESVIAPSLHWYNDSLINKERESGVLANL